MDEVYEAAELLMPEGDEDENGAESSPGPRSGRAPIELSLDALQHEYGRVTASNERQYAAVLRVIGLGFTATIALTAYLSADKENFEEPVYWLFPLLLPLLYALILQLMHRIQLVSYYIRDLEDELSRRLGVPFFHVENAIARSLFSVRTGSLAFLTTYLVMFCSAAVLHIALVCVCWHYLISSSRVPFWRGSIFVAVQLAIAIGMLATLGAYLRGTRTMYEQWKGRGYRASSGMRRGRASLVFLRYVILPRPLDFVFKGAIVAGSLLLTLLVLDVSLSPKIAAVAGLVLLCVDVLAKQATYVWNDVRDFDRDRSHPHKSGRPLPLIGVRRPGEILFYARAAAAVVLAVMLGIAVRYWWVLGLVLFIFVWQFLYDHWAKRDQRRKLVVASVGYVERALAGILVVTSVTGREDWAVIALLCTLIVAFAFLFLASYWWAEDLYLGRTATWVARYGQAIGTVAAVFMVPVWLALSFGYAHDGTRHNVAGLVVLGVVGAALVVGVRASLPACMGAYADPLRRLVFSIMIAGVTVALWFLLHAKIAVLAIALPAFFAAVYARLSYEDIAMLYLGRTVKRIAAGIQQTLFDEYERACVRVDPGPQPDAPAWTDLLASMYRRWAECHGFDVEGSSRTARAERLLVVRGHDIMARLRQECGIHERRDLEGEDRIALSHAYVEALRLETVPDDRERPEPADRLVRTYTFSQGNTPGVVVADPERPEVELQDATGAPVGLVDGALWTFLRERGRRVGATPRQPVGSREQ